MRTYLHAIAFLLILVSASTNSFSQAGDYSVTGYFFHPTSNRAISVIKTITQIDANTYEYSIGDLGASFSFQFDIDGGNNLVNWHAVGAPYPEPSSGFMTLDNPGGFVFTSTDQPGVSPWLHSTYNNKYDPINHIFYMHYGYATGATSQLGYNRQIYERLEAIPDAPIPVINSFSPVNGTAGTEVTIRGTNLGNIDPYYGIYFGNHYADKITTITDTLVKAIVGGGASGFVTAYDNINSTSGTLAGFTYTPPVANNTKWLTAGNAGFSAGNASNVCIGTGNTNIPYVVFLDATQTNKVVVMKLDTVSNQWVTVGQPVSPVKSRTPNIVLDKNNVPFVAYADSTSRVTVKKFNGTSWVGVGNAGFDSVSTATYPSKVQLAVDNAGRPYIVNYHLDVVKYNGTTWAALGVNDLATISGFGDVSLAVDRTTNTPYVATDGGPTYNNQAVVKKYTGSQWVFVGTPGFTNATAGVFYPDLIIDSSGNPVLAIQEDAGREQTSVYKFNGSSWQPIGSSFFSPGHTHFSSAAVDKDGTPSIFFSDNGFNDLGTAMRYNNTTQQWAVLGSRGFAKGLSFTSNGISIINHMPYVAFADTSNGGRVTVMYYAAAGVSISKNTSDTICKGTNVTFTATLTNTSGTPAYQWKRNNANAGTNSPVYATSALNNNDSVYCIVTLNSIADTSNKFTFKVNNLPAKPVITPSIPTTLVCPGKTVTLTSSAANGNVWSTGATTASIVVSTAGTYTVTVTNAAGCSSTSDATVVTYNVCAKPTGLATANITTTSAKLSWTAVTCAVGYQYEIRKKGTTPWTTAQVTGISKVVTGLQPSTIYQWRVITACKISPDTITSQVYTNGAEFTTLAAVIAGNTSLDITIAKGLSASVLPNPATSRATITVNNAAGAVRIKITDLSGKPVWQKTGAQQNSFDVDISRLSPGTYMVLVQDDKESKSMKLVKE